MLPVTDNIKQKNKNKERERGRERLLTLLAAMKMIYKFEAMNVPQQFVSGITFHYF